jgi:Xaa-Pro aminopeptidase
MAEVIAMDVAGRLPRLRERLGDAGCDALLVTHLTNVRYLTGFTGSAGVLLVLPDDALLVTDGRYRDQSREQLDAAGVDARIEITAVDQDKKLADAARGLQRVGLESMHVTWSAKRRYNMKVFDGSAIVATEGLVESLRLVKDEGEIARIEAACRIADDALAAVLPRLLDGPTERDFGLELEPGVVAQLADAVDVVLQRRRAVDLRLAVTQQVEVRSVQQQHDRTVRHGAPRCTRRRARRRRRARARRRWARRAPTSRR